MTSSTPEPEPRYSRYRRAYPSGTVVEPFYAARATLREVRLTHPMAKGEPVEDSLVGVGSRP
jgi:hypothetical protein